MAQKATSLERTSRICGVVAPYQGTTSLTHDDESILETLVQTAVKKGQKESYNVFLTVICDDANIHIARCLNQLRAHHPLLHIIALLPDNESELSSLSARIAFEQVETYADEVIRPHRPIEDYPLYAALYCDSLKVCSFGNPQFMSALREDLSYIHTACSVEQIKKI